jgi:hypothetical protein
MVSESVKTNKNKNKKKPVSKKNKRSKIKTSKHTFCTKKHFIKQVFHTTHAKVLYSASISCSS